MNGMDVWSSAVCSFDKQYYGITWSASGSVRAWTWCRENVALEENNLDHIGCDHTSTKAPDPIRTSKLSVLGRSEERRVGKECKSSCCMSHYVIIWYRFG